MNILLPTDFSENSRNAAVYALKFFQDIPCTFHLLHVLELPPQKSENGSLSMPREVREKFDHLLLWLNRFKKNPDHHFSTSFKSHYLIEAVRAQVLEKNIDLILMGTKGATNSQGVIIGKHTSDVMMKVKCPVLAISENAVYKEHKEILFPTDYKIHYGSKMLGTFLNLLSLSKANLKVLEIFTSEKEPTPEQVANRIFLQESFYPRVPELQTFYSSRNNPKKVFIANREVDMIVLAAKNLNLCQKFLRNHENNQIPFINQLPLLVLHG